VSGVTSLAAGPDHTCAVSQGEVYCWGDNGYGQLGREDAADGKPGAVPQLADIRSLACGDGFSCALAGDGSVYCWGSNDEGERGDAEASSSAQVKRVNLGGVRAIAAGYKHVCALTERAEVYCWGRNRFGQLGQTIDGQFTPDPTPIGRLTQPIP
jgi:alpha-tubulin suppressor-like RCC1 family protein